MEYLIILQLNKIYLQNCIFQYLLYNTLCLNIKSSEF